MITLIGVVAGEHEDGVAEPRLPTRLAEETAQRHIGIADALLDGQMLLGELCLILLGDGEWMVTGS